MCDSIPVYIEEVKAEPSVHIPERCNTGQVLIETLDTEPVVESYQVPPSVKEYHEPVGESFKVPPSLEEVNEHDGESFKGPYSVEESNWCVSIGTDNYKDKGRQANMESEGSELTLPAERELQEVNNLCISPPITWYASVTAERTIMCGSHWQALALLREVVELYCFTYGAEKVHEPF